MQGSEVAHLQLRQEQLLQRLAGLELTARQMDIAQRLAKLEQLAQGLEGKDMNAPPPFAAATVAESQQVTANAALPAKRCTAVELLRGIGEVSDVVRKVGDECERMGMHTAQLVRVRPDYYNLSLEERRGLLNAPTTAHLCKSLVMENTKATVEDLNMPGYHKYFLVVVQYEKPLNTEKLRTVVHRQWEGKIPKKRFNMRLVSSDTNFELTGFAHNAVTPFGCKTPPSEMPVVLAASVASLEPECLWLGGGETDLKLGLSLEDFQKAFDPMIEDIN